MNRNRTTGSAISGLVRDGRSTSAALAFRDDTRPATPASVVHHVIDGEIVGDEICGVTFTGYGFTLTCNKPTGHIGGHAQQGPGGSLGWAAHGRWVSA